MLSTNMAAPIRTYEESIALIMQQMGLDQSAFTIDDSEEWEDLDYFPEEGPTAYIDVHADPDFIDEDEATLNILDKVYNYSHVNTERPQQLPLEVPFATESLGRPNPWWDKISVLFDQSEEFRKMATEVKNIGDECRREKGVLGCEYDFQEVLSRVSHLEAKCKELVYNVLDTPDTPGVMPSKPKPEELYARVLPKSEIYDVGTGNAMKPKQVLNGFDCVIKGCDPKTGNTHIDKVTFEQAVEQELIPDEATLTSYNAVTQLSDEEEQKLSEYDGIHIFPDVESLIALNVGRATDEGCVSMGTNGSEWTDRKSKLSSQSPHKPGFSCAVTYKRENINITLDDQIIEGGPGFPTLTKPGIGMETDLGHKWDGQMFCLQVRNGKALLKQRNGMKQKGSTDFKGQFEVHLEQVKNLDGVVVGYVLLRVKFFNNMIPFHNGPSLRLFARKKILTIAGLPLIGPPVYDPSRVVLIGEETCVNLSVGRNHYFIQVDGYIARGEKTDHYHKYHWTVDLNYTDELADELEYHFSRKVKVRKPEKDGLWEFRVSVDDNYIALEPYRERSDKSMGNNIEHIKTTIGYAMGQF